MYFGDDISDFEQKIKRQSVFKHLKSWKLIHFIVKTGKLPALFIISIISTISIKLHNYSQFHPLPKSLNCPISTILLSRRRSQTRTIRASTALPNAINLQTGKPRPSPLALLGALAGPELRHNRVPERNHHNRCPKTETEGPGHEYQLAGLL